MCTAQNHEKRNLMRIRLPVASLSPWAAAFYQPALRHHGKAAQPNRMTHRSASA